MGCIRYIERKFSKSSMATIERANQIIEEYSNKGFRLTLRQLYYQFVSRDWIRNHQTEYKRLGSVVNDGRLAGLIDWEAIEDRGRGVEKIITWHDPSEIIDAVAKQYKQVVWRGQPNMVEVWVEKEALSGVIAPICRKLRIPYLSCKGYTSQSEMWESGHGRLRSYIKRGQTPVILHLGDHDPSGIDMTRDIEDRLSMFARGPVEIKRLALNFDQIEEYQPPPNPAKQTDSRFQQYADKFGDESWELDALNPEIISDLIKSAAMPLIDEDLMSVAMAAEAKERAQLQLVSDHWSKVVASLKKK